MSVPLILAPMADLSHRALRELIETFSGCDYYYSEMISAARILSAGVYEKYYLDAGPRPEKLVYQIEGGKEQNLAAAASLLDKTECAGIDINMGCCAPTILRSGAGAAWLFDSEKTKAMISLVRKNVMRHKLSVKLRIGKTDSFENLVSFCTMLQNQGVDIITLHPRTTKEKFRSWVRWEYIGQLKKELHIPVVGNGDITSVEDLCRRSADGSCSAVMAGRLAVRQPWCFAKAVTGPKFTGSKNAPSNLEETALLFLDLLSKYQPAEFYCSRAHRFFHYFCGNFMWAEYMRNELNRQEKITEMAETLKKFFKENPQENKPV
ncbi:tRNA-dihydrouridine synthase [Spirochaetia bacterium]|nr:tRNA-dihydrouridine synthase [Spirochaetia bacterium]